jgi:hypothetical protein
MTYQFKPSEFVENGAAIRAALTSQARPTARNFELLHRDWSERSDERPVNLAA